MVGGSNHQDQATSSSTESSDNQAKADNSVAGGSEHESNASDNLASTWDEVEEESRNGHASKVPKSGGKNVTLPVSSPVTTAPKSVPFDAWIDDLVEFQETVLPAAVTTNLTIAEALLKLEANKDIPSITIPDFHGDPLSYTDGPLQDTHPRQNPSY